ncbi:MAG: hypothetical protein WBC91_09335 [Phototrophicaceae bacterium]
MTILLLIRILIFIFGAILVLYTINSALRSFVLPRADRSLLTANVMRLIYFILSFGFKPKMPFAKKDYMLAMHPPYTMFLLPMIWLVLIIIGYTGMYWALDIDLSVREAFILSGSSLMTLGASFHDDLIVIALTFSQAALSMMLIALLIGYLPTMYSAFSQRELMVTKLEAYAGTPPSPTEMIRRLYYVQLLENPDQMQVLWTDWQDWFLQIEEQHTTLVLLNFYRSPKAARHWLTAAGCVLDTAAIIASSVAVERAAMGGIVLRSGFLTLRSIADYFDLHYDPDPHHGDSIQITRQEFDDVLNELSAYGVPIHADRDMCWDHYVGWRVNYDEVLIGLAQITNAPYAMWSSDRAREWLPDDIPQSEVSILERIRSTEN